MKLSSNSPTNKPTPLEGRQGGLKICIVVPSLSGGGAEFVAREWASWLTEFGDDVTIAITHPKATDIAPLGVQVVKLSGSNPLRHVLALRRLVRREKFDFVVGLLPYFNLLAILGSLPRSRNRPKVLISGRNVEVPFPEVHGRSVVVTRLISRVLYPLVHGYVAISHPVAAEAGALYRIPASRMSVVPNPSTAKVTNWRQQRHEASSTGGRSAAGSEVLNVIIPARLVQQKRPLVAVDAARCLTESGRAVVLHFFGDGPLRADIEEAASKAGVQTRFHGWVDNWFAQCPSTGVVVLTSLAEGFGNVLVEAAAIGLPSVASSRCLGSADAIVPGITGEFAAGDTARDYADAILKAAALELDVEEIQGWLDRFSPHSSGSKLRDFLVSLR